VSHHELYCCSAVISTNKAQTPAQERERALLFSARHWQISTRVREARTCGFSLTVTISQKNTARRCDDAFRRRRFQWTPHCLRREGRDAMTRSRSFTWATHERRKATLACRLLHTR